MARAVCVHAHQPTNKPARLIAPQPAKPGARKRSTSTNSAQPARVPAVPGATGDSPLPNPSAINREGWNPMKRQVARRGAARAASSRDIQATLTTR